jgi:hypothetical protein
MSRRVVSHPQQGYYQRESRNAKGAARYMKKAAHTQPNDNPQDMRAEYDFDYHTARPNRFAGRPRESLVVVLDPDVAEVFTTPESVNHILRALIANMPRKQNGPGR